MPSTVILGAQWGDEGKGKIVDFLSEKFDAVVRYQGGNNAGHTVIVNNTKFKLHLVPSGVIRGKRSLIASGVVIDPRVLLEEIAFFEKSGSPISPAVLGIDFRAHVIMPWHQFLDAERDKGKNRIGTTGRGIGPVYESKASRWGIRFEDLVDEATLRESVDRTYGMYEKTLKLVYGVSGLPSKEDLVLQYAKLGKTLAPYICDVSLEVDGFLKAGKDVLFEGAQGVLLDNNFGTYPFVTSSQPVAANAAASTGVSPRAIISVEAVVKAYTTRVGEGPFPTELPEEEAAPIREKGAEFGTTTGRPRRIGWLDITALRFGNRLNGYDGIHLTKLDVLGGLKKIKVCVSYEIAGKKSDFFPTRKSELLEAKPVYKELAGFEDLSAGDWKTAVEEGKKIGYASLPKEAEKYVAFIEKQSGLPVMTVSVGPGRTETIHKKAK